MTSTRQELCRVAPRSAQSPADPAVEEELRAAVRDGLEAQRGGVHLEVEPVGKKSGSTDIRKLLLLF